MSIEGEYEPSPWGPVADQVALYEQTDGAEGDDFGGGVCIILTTRGAKSGKVRKTPLMRVTDGERYAVVASLGGAPNNPVWFHNIVADPHVVLQDKATRKDYLAREVQGEERDRWWALATAAWPDYDTYQASTERVIPVFVLEPTG